jgi:hypothetical protein
MEKTRTSHLNHILILYPFFKRSIAAFQSLCLCPALWEMQSLLFYCSRSEQNIKHFLDLNYQKFYNLLHNTGVLPPEYCQLLLNILCLYYIF